MNTFISYISILCKGFNNINYYFIHTWQINNAGTNKGFRPLLQFTDEDIKQVCASIHSNFRFSKNKEKKFFFS